MFLANHRAELWAADFFTVPTVLCQMVFVFVLILTAGGALNT